MKHYILAVNPGSTSTKFALYIEEKLDFEHSLAHTNDELQGFERITEQFSFRKNIIMEELGRRKVDLARIKAVVGRGGLLKPIESGVYEVNKLMKSDLLSGERGSHASNLGGLIASDIASEIAGARAFIVDPVVVDEMQDVARISGHPLFERRSVFHALNQKAVARLYASETGRPYNELNLVVAHMGGGISVGAHRKGKVVDVNNALNGDGPFSPERSGTLPAGQLVDLCFSGEISKNEAARMLTGEGGMVAYLGTNDFREICNRAVAGDKKALLIQEAASYQVAKEIAAMCAVLEGDVDAILLTGGMAYQELNVNYIKRLVASFASVVVYPGEDELKSLAMNGLMVLRGELEPKEYC
ncbi:MAG: butyrate kinase [Marinilabiliaceae bacterium]|jgi:butyrate kinase|nr:butyrate kinase [Marinilabiliaceae bacterium]